MQNYINIGATFSPCRQYRYALWRRWAEGEDWLAFIGLNPSTADESDDDPTIRRVVGFAKREGYGGLVMLNMYAWRSTDPSKLSDTCYPIGPKNNATIREWCNRAGLIVIGCGAQCTLGRFEYVRDTLRIDGHYNKLRALGFTKAGMPKHPLYLPADSPLMTMDRRAA